MQSVSGALALVVLVASVTDGLAFTPNKTPLSSAQKNIETAGNVVAIVLPITAGSIALYKHDRVGVAQLLVQSALTVGTAYALKSIVREQRPDGSNYQSFPSDTTAIAASGSSFLWRRYGWEYGLPATVMTEFVAYSRVQARQHRWYDTLASSGIAMGYSYLLGTRFRERHGVDTSLSVAPDEAMVRLSYQW